MLAVLGKNKSPKLGDSVIFGTYYEQKAMPVKWRVIDVDPYLHTALLLADSYCGKTDKPSEYKTLPSRLFSEDEMKLISYFGRLTFNYFKKNCPFVLSNTNKIFYPYGDGNASEYWIFNGYSNTYYTVTTEGETEGGNGTNFLRPLMLVKYDCIPAEKEEEKEKKEKTMADEKLTDAAAVLGVLAGIGSWWIF